ncbi:Ppx/GppA phosphatase family protein [Scrofimicrobium sp. R131]|uniref:Ppx/GppA phosphatase family protein n=1 Tax=Scrofimicrobium appendicitidis TaxID=3079930 RepID=A0AAU7V7Y5_9ACTO
MTRVAAFDCGTNSLRLLIADLNPGGPDPLVDVSREMRIVRLGEHVDETGRLSSAAIERTLAAVDEYRELIDRFGAERLRFVATSAMRDAANGNELVEAVRARLGVTPEVIPGNEEAALSFAGATATLGGYPNTPILLVDIGGGSTEFVLGDDWVQASLSVNMGSVRVTERFDTQPENLAGIAAATQWVDQQLDLVEEEIDFGLIRSVVGVAGTVTTLAGQALDVPEYSPNVTHGAFLSWEQWGAAARFMIEEPVETKAALPFMPTGREDVIGAGALIWQQILRRVRRRTEDLGLDLGGAYCSEHDILDGIALSLAD